MHTVGKVRSVCTSARPTHQPRMRLVTGPRIILADDHALLLDAFRALLEPDHRIVGTAQNGIALLEIASTLAPDVIVLDVAMPLLGGLEAGRQLKKQLPNVKLVYLTVNEDPYLAVEAMRLGASGFLLKKSAASELFIAIRTALRGSTYVTPQLRQAINDMFIRDPEGKNAGKELTPRQKEVLQLLAEGKSMKEAAAVLNITARTIAFHKYRMMEDLNIKTTADLIQFAITHYIVIPPSRAGSGNDK